MTNITKSLLAIMLSVPLVFSLMGGCGNTSDLADKKAHAHPEPTPAPVMECEYDEARQLIWDLTVECLVSEGFFTQEEANSLVTPCYNEIDDCEDPCCETQHHFKHFIYKQIYGEPDIFHEDLQYWQTCTVDSIGLCVIELPDFSPVPVTTPTPEPTPNPTPNPTPPDNCNNGVGNGPDCAPPGNPPNNDDGSECEPGNPCNNPNN